MTAERYLRNVSYAALFQLFFGLPTILYPREDVMPLKDALKAVIVLSVLIFVYCLNARKMLKKEGKI